MPRPSSRTRISPSSARMASRTRSKPGVASRAAVTRPFSTTRGERALGPADRVVCGGEERDAHASVHRLQITRLGEDLADGVLAADVLHPGVVAHVQLGRLQPRREDQTLAAARDHRGSGRGRRGASARGRPRGSSRGRRPRRRCRGRPPRRACARGGGARSPSGSAGRAPAGCGRRPSGSSATGSRRPDRRGDKRSSATRTVSASPSNSRKVASGRQRR